MAAIAALSARVRRRATKLGVRDEFLFMHASGAQLRQPALVDDGVLRPVVGRAADGYTTTSLSPSAG